MLHSATEAFRRMRRTERVLDIHIAGRDAERADQATATLQADSDAFESLPAVSNRDIALKAKEAIVSLHAEGSDSAADLLRAFFRQPMARDAAWLNTLRKRSLAVSLMAPNADYAIRLLQSIIAGVAKPRLV